MLSLTGRIVFAFLIMAGVAAARYRASYACTETSIPVLRGFFISTSAQNILSGIDDLIIKALRSLVLVT